MKGKSKRIISMVLEWLLLVSLTLSNMNVTYADIKDGDKGTASLESLGELGEVKIGNKSEKGNWLKTQIDDVDVFCLDLGLACHTGYVYKAKTSTISSDSSSTKTALKAKVGYWYAVKKKYSNKAWVYAQSLIWSIEENRTSEDQLKDVIKQVKDNTNYYKDDSIYSDIFDISGKVSCEIVTWEYSEKTDEDEVQTLMQITGMDISYRPKSLTKTEAYRQRITLNKNDEDGKPISQVKFKFTVKNVKELDSYKYNGWGDAVSDDVDSNATRFNQTVLTDSKGVITFRFTYKLQAKKYYYIADNDLEKMTGDDKKKLKADWDDKGYSYASDLTKASAEKLANADINSQIDKISNTYVIEEIDANNDNLLESFTVETGADKVVEQTANKITITLTKADSWTKVNDKWPETADETYGNYSLAYKPVLKDNYKKVRIEAVKVDSETGSVTQGDASLKGAVYGVYSDSGCTKLLDKYTTDDKCKFSTKYYRCGTNLYLKEITAPTGYVKNDKVYSIDTDGKKFSVEYNVVEKRLDEDVVTGDVSIIKGMSNGFAGIVTPEVNAEFEIFLASAGSYDKAKNTERDILKTDITGYAKSKKMPYGTYVVHQTVGAANTEKCPDFYVNVTEHGKTYHYLLNNPEFTAYLKIVKKDSRTHQTVLKSGTTYQIYSVDKDGKETIVTQIHSNGNAIEKVDKFVTDDTGEIITYQKLKAGTYKVYEVEGPKGYKVNTKPVTVVIDSNSYKTMKDADGNDYLYAEVEYYNSETYGRFTVNKTGMVLDDSPDTPQNAETIPMVSQNTPIMSLSANIEDNNTQNDTDELQEKDEKEQSRVIINPFNYKEMTLKNVVFELVAREDIMSQDNQGTVLYKKDSVVATITTGKSAVFNNPIKGICKSKLNADGTVTLDVPLGEYTLNEVKTAYGYVLPDPASWDLSFRWDNKNDEYVLDVSENTTDGTVNVHNDLVSTKISLEKKDSKNEKPIADAVFGFYSKDDIYDVYGNVVVKADEKICDVTTDKDGKASIPFDVPVMDEEYGQSDDNEANLNSGDYYFKEESVSDSYFISEEPHFVHLEYVDQNTAEVTADVTVLEDQTEVIVDKMMIASSKEVEGCHLKITDTEGNEIISWITGDKNSIKLNENLTELGYSNVYVEVAESSADNSKIDALNAITIHGLLHDKEYVLSETKPADGFVTASDITFMIKQKVEAAEFTQEVLIKNGDEFKSCEENKVVMYDDVTKVEISKLMIASSLELPGCELEITHKESGEVIDSWTSTDKPHLIENIFVVGETYVLTEKRPAEGFVTAESIEFTVADTGEVQSVKMEDDTTKLEFSKVSITDGVELPGCKLKVTDKETGEVIDKWTSTEATHVVEGKYVANKTYILSETKPADGFATATDVEFTVKDDGTIQKVKMTDDTTKIEFSKFASDTKKQLEGAKYEVYDSKGKKVYKFTTGKKAELIEGVLKVGETYTFKEVDAPENYKLADDVKIKVKDTGKVQKLKAVDARIPVVPDTPQTGIYNNCLKVALIALFALMLMICWSCLHINRKGKHEKN
ncbi:MAG: hypothetical protein K6G88_07715 [Lachnospiraceae bacterium]|nr:hypothetical protein [Lachnospiraceae bacterium]